MAWILGTVCGNYNPLTVLLAMFMTAIIVGSLATYAYLAKTEFNCCTGIGVLAIPSIIIGVATGIAFMNPAVGFIFAIACWCFGLYLVIDIYLILG